MNENSFEMRLNALQAALPEELRHPSVIRALQAALAEDLDSQADFSRLWPSPAQGDVSSQATMPAERILHGRIFAKSQGVVAGLPVAQAVFFLVDPQVKFTQHAQDGQTVSPGTLLAEVSGSGRSLLSSERTALNFLGRMSGTASLAQRFVQAVAGTHATILDTRKTAPGLRYFDKYAVKMGGAKNHRIGLFDMVMVKDNHIDGAGGIRQAVEGVRQRYGSQYAIEVEVKNLDELNEALSLGVERIMLDNMSHEQMHQAVVITAGRTKLEASGNVTLETVKAIAETGVDFISSGALTHSAMVFDISMRIG